jgi:hypothetical protein
MSELDDAIAILESAVARLEATAAQPAAEPAADHARTAEIAEQLTARVDAALARLEKLLAEGG